MKSWKRWQQVKMNGKKSCSLACGCCVAENRKEKMLINIVEDDMMKMFTGYFDIDETFEPF